MQDKKQLIRERPNILRPCSIFLKKEALRTFTAQAGKIIRDNSTDSQTNSHKCPFPTDLAAIPTDTGKIDQDHRIKTEENRTAANIETHERGRSH
jgi:hypothetical protein